MKHEDNITAGHKASFLSCVWNISIAIKLLKLKKLKSIKIHKITDVTSNQSVFSILKAHQIKLLRKCLETVKLLANMLCYGTWIFNFRIPSRKTL